MSTTTKPTTRRRRPLTWREVLQTDVWTLTAHGTYRHTDGRTVVVDRRDGGHGFVRTNADGTRPGPKLRIEWWEEIRDWATA